MPRLFNTRSRAESERTKYVGYGSEANEGNHLMNQKLLCYSIPFALLFAACDSEDPSSANGPSNPDGKTDVVGTSGGTTGGESADSTSTGGETSDCEQTALRLGTAFYHLSNGGIVDEDADIAVRAVKDPSEEDPDLMYTVGDSTDEKSWNIFLDPESCSVISAGNLAILRTGLDIDTSVLDDNGDPIERETRCDTTALSIGLNLYRPQLDEVPEFLLQDEFIWDGVNADQSVLAYSVSYERPEFGAWGIFVDPETCHVLAVN